jgi:DNA repair protein RecO (recombination protein O)
MAIQKTEAIVLKTQPLRTSSLIVTFFSRSFGKLKGVAKGVRLERELRGGIYELFTRLEIVYYEKTRSDLHLLSEADIVDSYDPLRSRLESICYAGYFSELVDELCEVHDPHEKIFDLLDFCYRYLSSLPGPRVARLFEIKLLNEIGWLPFLDACLMCGEKKLEQGFFSAMQGALLCSRCHDRHQDARPIAAAPLALMRYYIHHSLEESLRQATSRQTDDALEDLMNRFFTQRLHRPLKTRQFIDKIAPVLSES